jgi:hypothetical protein
MTQRLPKQLLFNTQLTVSQADNGYTVPSNTTMTISALSFNNTSVTAQKVTINAVPAGQSIFDGNAILSDFVIPAVGAAPTAVPALVGQHFEAGTRLGFAADAAGAISPLLSGYLTTA